ncbi:MAG: glycosyltransferase [Pelatocladus maniniholoensis HA4357-MV3]|jgi:glycosyltransferase involved in cell wall biosynthesis|uniref:Glycosyltransferase n=1 Tax=Pelatocladus maniniholoensis HA4357-MV3 TaxID=1117104 RepID=A0A9E3H5V0_9NOST|nr:glycosyltransferase [Pelatocladus maniniholoensis HA4357-MV3]BAZ69592.1 putative glycosyltransferase [Fischerella sp. NIES-4106]
MKVSVVIPCLNAEKTIAVQLEALTHQQWSQAWEVIISDNGSSDSTLSIVEKYQMIIPNLRIVDASDRIGASHARNVGAKAAEGEAILFIDADDEVAPGWLAAMGEALSKYDFVAGHDDYNKLNNSWVVKSYQLENGSGVMENTYYLPFAGSGNLGIKRAIHEKIGGFDETLYQSEDVDYCWRVSYVGTKLHYVPDAIAHIRLRNSLASIYHRSWIVGKGGILVYKKHRPLGMPQLVTWKTLLKTSVILTFQMLFLQIRDKESFTKWLISLAWRGGQLWGCIKYQYLPL